MRYYKKLNISVLLIALLFAGEGIRAQVYSSENGYAKFEASTSISSYSGESNSLVGNIDLQSKELAFRLPVESIETGVAMRDRDMQKLLDIEHFQYITFQGNLLSDFVPDSEKQKVTATGTFVIKNENREITVEGTLQKTGGGLQLEANWTLLLSDYNVDRPSKFFAKVRDEHKITISILLEEAKE